MAPLPALILDWVITAFWPILGAEGMKHYSGILFAQAGMLVGGLLMLPWVLRQGRWRRLLARELAVPMLGIGFFSATATAIYISALNFTTPANAAIVAQVEVLYSALLCAFVLKEPLGLKHGAASALVVGGTGLVMLNDLQSPRWRGDLMILLTPWMYQCSHIIVKRLPQGLDPLLVTCGRVYYGFLVLLPWAAWSALSGGRWSWEPQALMLVGAQGLLMSCLNFILWYMAIMKMDLAKATTIMLSYPALTVLLSWLLGREHIIASQVIGLALTFAGAFWTSRLVLETQAKHA